MANNTNQFFVMSYREYLNIIFHLEGAREQCSYNIFNVHSEIIIDTFYDFCKSLNTKYSGISSEFHTSKYVASYKISRELRVPN